MELAVDIVGVIGLMAIGGMVTNIMSTIMFKMKVNAVAGGVKSLFNQGGEHEKSDIS